MIPQYIPMAPTLVRAPFHRPGWIYERKEDGWRMLAYKNGAAVRLVSRHGVDHTRRFPEIAAAVGKLPASTLVLDGEVCVFDSQLVSQFHLLGDTSDELATPPVYIAFDVLQAKVRDLQPLTELRATALCRQQCILEIPHVSLGNLPYRQVSTGGREATQGQQPVRPQLRGGLAFTEVFFKENAQGRIIRTRTLATLEQGASSSARRVGSR